jgi:hypothetical protein
MLRVFKFYLAATLGWMFLALASTALKAQNTANGSIVGNVTDASGAALPNVLVTVSSPQLEVPQVTSTTDASGNYKVLNLPAPGVYHIAFSHQGFQTFDVNALNLTVGFAAKVDARMQIGAVTQTVSVSAVSPVVDTVSDATETTIVRQQISYVPKSVGIQELLPMAAGVTLNGKPDVGDSNLASRTTATTYGIPLELTLGIEGINSATSHDEDTAVYLDDFAIQEDEIKTSGNNAEVAFPGLDEVLVMKSGSNTYHGEYRVDNENPRFQGNNITPALAGPPNNLKFTNPLTKAGYYDYAADLGGRVIRDRLWLYGGLSNQSVDQGEVNFYAAPDASGCWTCGDAIPATIWARLPEENGKFNWQIAPSTQLIGSWLHGNKHINNQGSSTLNPLPSDMQEIQPDDVWKGEIQVVKSKWILDAMAGYGGYRTTYAPESAAYIGAYGWTKGTNFAGDPSEEEVSTGLYTGVNDEAEEYHINNRYEMNASFAFLPVGRHLGGTHQLKVGTTDDWENEELQIPREMATGDYLLKFNNGTPYEITAFNFPELPYGFLYSQAFYLTDIWSLKHVTLNLGVRGERYNSFLPSQTTSAVEFADIFPKTSIPNTTVLTWVDVAPRVGAVWDVRGNGNTVVKGSFGMFGDTMGFDYPTVYDPVGVSSLTYNWSGPCQATAPLAPVEYNCDVTSAFLATLPSLTPISSTGGISQIINRNLKQDKTYEFVAGIERQVAPNFGVKASYIGHLIYNLFNAETNGGSVGPSTTYNGTGINVGHPYSSYTLPATFTDAMTGAPVTVYTYPAETSTCASTGCTSNEFLNTPTSRPDIYQSIEFVATKQNARGWDVTGSFWITKDHRWINGLAGLQGSPDDSFYPIDNTWNWQARADAVYNLPRGFRVSTFYRQQSGAYGQRTEVFSGTGSNGQKLNQGSVTMNMGPFGQYKGPTVEVWNVEGAKAFTFHDRMHLELNFQVFNLLNGSGAVTTNYQTTTNPARPTFGDVTSIESARVARIGTQFSF